MSNPIAIVVFVRLPVPGQCKTRLAGPPGVGKDAACQFYKLCAEHIMKVCASLPGSRLVIQHSSQDSTPSIETWVHATLQGATSASVLPQLTDPDLGVKMCTALQHQLDQPGTRKVLLVGSDIPDLSTHVLSRALDALDSHQAVFGPAADGGYYLVGLTKALPQLFQGVKWSTPAVLQQTLLACRAAGVHTAIDLPTLQDIDTLEDLRAWYTNLDSRQEKREVELGNVKDMTDCGSLAGTWTALTSYVGEVLLSHEGRHMSAQ